VGVTTFSPNALEKRLRDAKCQLWAGRDFLQFNVTLPTAKLMSGQGPRGVVAKALGLRG
jgi:hypothetical protein